MNLFLYKCNFIPHVNWMAWRGTCSVSCREALGHPNAETAEEARMRRTAQMDTSFGGREGHSGRVSFPFLVI